MIFGGRERSMPRPSEIPGPARTGAVVLGTVALVLGLTACSGAEGEAPVGLARASETSAPPEPTHVPDEAADDDGSEQAHVEAAEETYRGYVTAMNTLAQSGFADPASVDQLLWGDSEYRQAVMDSIMDKRARGITQTGEQTIADLAVAQYLPDPSGAGAEGVVLDVCIDDAGLDQVDPNGTTILVEDGVDRRPATVTLGHQTDGRWTVSTIEWVEGQTC